MQQPVSFTNYGKTVMKVNLSGLSSKAYFECIGLTLNEVKLLWVVIYILIYNL